ncbi:MAG: fibronectin [Calditrichaeota bacterium]|nr:MAG: fibronectin [Calditrichota bacterium]MBL1205414.1 fibronectin [Calditrichota bacterium]NOG45243.1 fibronectin [Calditrichota bacterium]
MKYLIFGFLVFYSLSFADESKWIAIGDLKNWYSSSGMEREVGRRGLIPDQQDGLRWPALYSFQDVQAAKALWIGAIDYSDPLANGKTFSHKVVHNGPRVLNEQSEFMPVEFKLIGKFNHPEVTVDGIPASNTVLDDLVDEIDASILADRMLLNVVNTGLGVTMTRKIHAFSQQDHDNYFIYDYVFKNTGIIDLDGTVVNQTLKGVMFFFQYRYAPTREIGPYGFDYAPQSTSWGHSTMNDVRGEDPNSGDPFRALYSWLGLHSNQSVNIIGGPNADGDGLLGAAQFVGNVVLHADTSPQNQANDPFQPTTTHYIGSDLGIQSGNDQFNSAQMTAEYAAMTKGHAIVRHADAVGDGFADAFGGTGGGYSHSQGFGPYTLAPGDSIHIVIAEGVSGLSRDKCYSIGDEWLNGGPLIKPDGSTAANADEFKNAWVFTGRDSLFKTFNNAITTFENGLNVPSPPPPPEKFEVNSGGDRISLSWSANAESSPGFSGYKIYRAIEKPDTTYELLFSCGTGTSHPEIVNEYDDRSPQRGFDYYYYIVSFDDGSTNNGQPLISSKFFTLTNEPAFLKRPPGERLSDIRAVPNPFNIRAREIQFGINDGKDKILFVNLPPKCRIKIYTERGDLVKKIEHLDGSGDEEWNSITSSRQTVVSGVYIAYIEVLEDDIDPETSKLKFKKGSSTYVKFIIIR